jgi:hypothetical protein
MVITGMSGMGYEVMDALLEVNELHGIDIM